MCYLIIVVAQSSAQFIIIHISFVLPQTPKFGHLLRLKQLELAIIRCPADQVLMALVQQQLQQELPQCNGTLHVCYTHSSWRRELRVDASFNFCIFFRTK